MIRLNTKGKINLILLTVKALMKIVRRVHVHTFQICFKENICIVQPGEKPVAKDTLNN